MLTNERSRPFLQACVIEIASIPHHEEEAIAPTTCLYQHGLIDAERPDIKDFVTRVSVMQIAELLAGSEDIAVFWTSVRMLIGLSVEVNITEI